MGYTNGLLCQNTAVPTQGVMGIFQSTVRHWTSLLFGGWSNAEARARAEVATAAEQQDNHDSATRHGAGARANEKRVRDGEEDASTRRDDNRREEETVSKRRRLTPPNNITSHLAQSQRRYQAPRRFAQTLNTREHRSQGRTAFAQSQRPYDRRHTLFTQSLNRKSLLEARERQRVRSVETRSAGQPLLRSPSTREEIDDLFTPKRHGLLDDRFAYLTPEASPRDATPSTDRSARTDIHRKFSDSVASTESRTSVDSIPFVLHPNKVSTHTSYRSTLERAVRPVRRESGPSEPIDYCRRIQALLRDDEEDAPRLSRRKQLELEEKKRVWEKEELRKKREAEEQRLLEEAEAKKKLRRKPKGPLVPPLDQEWENRVRETVDPRKPSRVITTTIGGTELIPKDFGTVLGQRAWLNDEIINGYIEWVVDCANILTAPNKKIGTEKVVPKFIAHNSFFYEGLTKKGAASTDRVMKRKLAPGQSLWQVETVLIPIMRHSHWTIGAVRPVSKTIEYFDSFGGRSALGDQFRSQMRAWLAHQLGSSYVAEDWTEPDTRCASQSNGWDCGVFVCTNAFCVAFGLETSCYVERDMELQRKRIAAVMLNRGFHGDFAWEKGGW